MADETESLRLGVEFDGAAGVNAFMGALQPIPGAVAQIMGQVGDGTNRDSAVMRKHGEAIADAIYRGYQAQAAGFQINGRELLASAGLSQGEISKNLDMLERVEQVMGRLSGGLRTGEAGSSLAVDVAATHALEANLALVDKRAAAAEKRIRHLSEAWAAVQKIGGVNLAVGDPMSADGASWSPRLQNALARTGVDLSRLAVQMDKSGGLAVDRNDKAVMEAITGQMEIARAQQKAYSQQGDSLRSLADTLRRAPLIDPSEDQARRILTPKPEPIATEVSRTRQIAQAADVPTATAAKAVAARTRSERELIIDGRAEGMSLRAIRDAYGIPYNRVWRESQDGDAIAARRAEMERDRIVDQIARGVPYRTIAESEGVTYSRVQTTGKRESEAIEARKVELAAERVELLKTPTERGAARTPDERAAIQERIARGESYRSIARELEVPYNRVQRTGVQDADRIALLREQNREAAIAQAEKDYVSRRVAGDSRVNARDNAARDDISISAGRAKQLDELFAEEIAVRKAGIAAMRASIAQRAEDATVRAPRRTQFDTEAQEYAPNLAEDRLMREYRAVQRGSSGWGPDGQMTDRLQGYFNLENGPEILERRFAEWQARQEAGTRHLRDASAYERVWANLEPSESELAERRAQAERRAALDERWQSVGAQRGQRLGGEIDGDAMRKAVAGGSAELDKARASLVAAETALARLNRGTSEYQAATERVRAAQDAVTRQENEVAARMRRGLLDVTPRSSLTSSPMHLGPAAYGEGSEAARQAELDAYRERVTALNARREAVETARRERRLALQTAASGTMMLGPEDDGGARQAELDAYRERRTALNERRQALIDARRARLEAERGDSGPSRFSRMNVGPDRVSYDAYGRIVRTPEAPRSAADIQADRDRLIQAFGGQRGFREQFREGFAGPRDGETGYMFGQTARISLFYGAAYRALNFLQEAIVNITQETLAYQDALTDLAVATQASRQENAALATDLGATAASAGYMPSQGVTMGARAMGLYGVAAAPREDQERAARISAEVATQVARSANSKDPAAVQTQLAGAARAFGFGVDRLTDLQDMITYISRSTGQTPTELLGATSNIATLGRAAGFSPEQLMAIVAQVGTTTGQNPEATAGQFRQVLSREFDKVATAAQSIFGMDTSGMSTTEEVLSAVSQLRMSQQQVNDFTATFGKGGSQTVAMIMLEDWGRIQGLASGATSSPGIGKSTYEQTMANVGKQLQVLGSSAMELGLKVVETGLVDWLVLVVAGANQLVDALSYLLDIFNQIPRPIRSVGLALGEMALAAKLFKGSGLMAEVLDKGGRGARAVTFAQGIPGAFGLPMFGKGAPENNVTIPFARPLPAQLNLAAGASYLRSGFSGMFHLDAAGRDALRNSTRAGVGGAYDRVRGATGLTGAGLLTGVAVAALAADQVARSFQNVSQAGEALSSVQMRMARALTESDYLDVASAARDARAKVEAGTLDGMKVGDVSALIPSIFGQIFNRDEIDRLTKVEDEARQRASEVAARQEKAESTRTSAIFTDFSTDGISASLETLTTRGYNAKQQLDLLSEAVGRFGEVSREGVLGPRAIISTDQFDGVAADIARGAVGAIGTTADWQRFTFDAKKRNGSYGDDAEIARAAKRSAEILGDADRIGEVQGAVRDSILESLEVMRDGSGTGYALIDDSTASSIVTNTQEKVRGMFSEDEWTKLGGEVQAALLNGIGLRVKGVLDAFGGEVSTANLSGYMDLLPGLAQGSATLAQRQSGTQLSFDETLLAELEAGRANILDTVKGAGGVLTEEQARKLSEIDLQIVEATRSLMESRIAEIDRVLDLQNSRLNSDDVAGQLENKAAALEQQRAQAQRAWSDSVVRDNMGRTVSQDDAAYQRYLATMAEQQVNARSQAANALAILQSSRTMYVSPGDSRGMASAALQQTLDALASGQYTEGSAEWNALIQARTQGGFSVRQANIAGINANALANIDPRNDLGRIRQQMANARRELGLYPAGDQQAGALRDQINQLQQQEREAIVARANSLASSRIAGKESGLAQARVAVANAQRTLGSQLEGTAGYYEALSGLRSAQAALAAQERAQADRARRLGSDLTDPVEQAKLDVQAAVEELNAARARGDGKDTIDQNRLNVRNAQNREEAAAFSQRLSDVQIAEELGRISHSQYMNYLQSEHDRLSAIAERTRQQQDQLDQVDKLMQSAAEQLQGQFNIGDIDLPSVYEVRRAMQSGAPTAVSDYSHSNNVVNISGVDFDQVVEYFEEMLGIGAMSRRGAGNRK